MGYEQNSKKNVQNKKTADVQISGLKPLRDWYKTPRKSLKIRVFPGGSMFMRLSGMTLCCYRSTGGCTSNVTRCFVGAWSSVWEWREIIYAISIVFLWTIYTEPINHKFVRHFSSTGWTNISCAIWHHTFCTYWIIIIVCVNGKLYLSHLGKKGNEYLSHPTKPL